MPRLRHALPVALALLTSAPAAAYLYDGNEMLDHCRKRSSVCVGFIAGVLDGADYARLSDRRMLCIPVGVQIGQLSDIFVRHLENNPERRHWGAVVLLTDAIQAAFPCPDPLAQ